MKTQNMKRKRSNNKINSNNKKNNNNNKINNNNNKNNNNKNNNNHNNNKNYLIPSQPQLSAPTQTLPQPSQTKENHLNQSIDLLVSQVTLPQLRCSASTNQIQGKLTTTKVIKKLGELAPNPIIASSRASRFAASGHRQAAIPSSRIKPDCKIPDLVLTISRKSNFSVYLKKSLLHFQKFKACKITLLAMGCAISMCFSLAMAIESNLQIGDSCRLVRSITTGTVIVGDEITLKDQTQETDLIYQTRNQASVKIELRVEFIHDQSKSLTSQLFS